MSKRAFGFTVASLLRHVPCFGGVFLPLCSLAPSGFRVPNNASWTSACASPIEIDTEGLVCHCGRVKGLLHESDRSVEKDFARIDSYLRRGVEDEVHI